MVKPFLTSLRSVLVWRLAPSPDRIAPPGRDLLIDGLRGVAALIVVIEHALAEIPDASFVLRGFFNGRAAVLLFFTLSGYVIGRANHRAWADGSRRAYWSRRMERLAPLYLLAVLFAFAVALLLNEPADQRNFLVHLLCLQNHESYGPILFHPITVNRPLWTLNYELVFYTLFLLVWALRPSAWLAFGLCLASALVTVVSSNRLDFLASYSVGFAFWLAGLALAWAPRAPSSDVSPTRTFPLVGLLLLVIATVQLAPFSIVVRSLGFSSFARPWVDLGNLTVLPLCVAIVGLASGALPRLGRTGLALCIGPAVLTLLAALATGRDLLDNFWLAPGLVSVAGLAALVFRPASSAWLRHLAPVGGLSYALYLFHLPVICLACAAFPGHRTLAVAFALALSFVLAWWLETRLQAWFLVRLRPRPAPAPSLP